MANKHIRVLTSGTFDLFHFGHLNMIKRAKELGNILYVAVSTDEFNKIKGKKSYHTLDQRMDNLRSIQDIDFLIEEKDWDSVTNIIKDFDIDVFCIGDDWKDDEHFKRLPCKVVFLERTPDISTTKIKKALGYGK